MNDRSVRVNVGCLGCSLWVIGLIVFVFVLTHVGPIWHDLSRIVGS